MMCDSVSLCISVRLAWVLSSIAAVRGMLVILLEVRPWCSSRHDALDVMPKNDPCLVQCGFHFQVFHALISNVSLHEHDA